MLEERMGVDGVRYNSGEAVITGEKEKIPWENIRICRWKKIILGHADAEIKEIIICQSNKEFLFWTHAEGKGNLW
jgi:hypothetical protein